MARRRVKKRTHVGAANGANLSKSSVADRTPKSMVIRIGASEVGPSVSQLVKDMRLVMEPNTASRLKERRANKLRDYTTMAGPLAVSHFLLFSRSSTGNTNLRLARTPRGPTLNFRVEKYSLSKDIMNSQKHPLTGGKHFQTAPLLVMNNFLTSALESTANPNTPSIPPHLERLVTTLFQSLFPPIAPQATPLSSIRRVLLLNRELDPSKPGTYVLNLRHYAITTKVTGLPRAIRRLNAAEKLITSREKRKKGGLPNLGKLEDVADYMLNPESGGFTSASESEIETDAEVEVLAPSMRRVLNKRDLQRRRDESAAVEGKYGAEAPRAEPRSEVEKRAVKLIELGPRMTLRLTKVEEDLCNGKVLWHEYVQKTREEERQLDKVWQVRNDEKTERKRVQRENVERKRKEKKESGETENGGDDDEDDKFDDYDMDDDVWDGQVDDRMSEDDQDGEAMQHEQ